MRIGIDGRILQESHRSGVPDYVHQVITHMVIAHPEIDFVIFCNSFRDIKRHLPTLPLNATYKIYRFPNKVLEVLWPILPYPKIDKLLGVDVFFSPHIYYIPLSKDCKKIVTIHDLSFVRDKRYFNWRKNMWHFFMRPKRITRNADHIISVSSATARELVQHYNIHQEKISVIPNGYEPNRTMASGEENSHTNSAYFFFLSTIEPRKNLISVAHAIQHAAKKDSSIHLVAGGKRGWISKRDFAAIQKTKQVNLTGYLDEETIRQHYMHASCFVFTPWHEGFGLAVLDALMANKPIITSSSASLPELATNRAIQINPHYIYDCAEAMHELAKDDILKQTLINKTTDFSHPDWQKVADKTLEVITELSCKTNTNT